MNPTQFAPRYTGAPIVPFARPVPFAYGRGVCRACGQPSASCCCGCRQCRSEAKELTADPTTKPQRNVPLGSTLEALRTSTDFARAPAESVGFDIAFVGGGCCVHISVEFAPLTPTSASSVLIGVRDADGTILAWQKTLQPGAGYTVKESVITTNPGALVLVLVNNMIARVRWCEVFSC